MAWYNSSWTRRVSVTVALDKTLSRVDLSNMPAGFWSFVQDGGADIRVTKSDGTTEVARDVRSCSTSAETGWLVFATGESKSASTGVYYVYIGNSGASDYGASDTYGSENVYDSEHVLVLSLDESPAASAPQFVDRTSNNTDGTANGTMTSGDSVTGIMDSAVDFDGTDDYISASPTFPTGSFTAYCLAKLDSNPSAFKSMSGIDHSDTGLFGLFYLQVNSSNAWNVSVFNTSGNGFDATDTGSVTTGSFQFVAITYDDSTKTVAINVNGAEKDTGTLTGTRATATGSLSIGAAYYNNTRSDFFPGDIDEYVLLNVALSETELGKIEDEIRTNSSAITFGSLEAEAAVASYSWTFNGRERQWTVEFFVDGFAGSTTTLCAGAEMVGRWGFNTGGFDDRIRASELRLEVIDPDLVLYDTLTDTDKTESDFKLKLTDSTGTYTIRMRVRLDEVSTLLVEGLEEQVTSLYAYCSMADLQGVDAVTATSSTIHNLFRLILVSSGIGQDIEYYIAHQAENASTGASDAILDFHRFNRLDLIFAEEGRKIDSMYDQLRGLLEGYGAVAINGLDGKWHVKHEYSLGEVLTDRGAQFYDFEGGTLSVLATLTQSTKLLTNQILGRSTIKSPLIPVQAVQVERGNARKFFSVDIMKHGDFEYGWVSSTESEVWETTLGGDLQRSTNSDTGSYAAVLASGTNQVRQRLLRFGGGFQDLDIEIAVRWAFESVNASTTVSGNTYIQVEYQSDAAGIFWTAPGGGTWNLAGIDVIDVDGSMVANGDPLVYATLVTTIYGPLPDLNTSIIDHLDGYLRIYLWNASTNYAAYFDTLEVRLKKSDSAKMNYRAVSGRYDISGQLIGSGGIVQQKVPWYNGLLGIDAASDGTRDSVHAMMQVITTTAGSWIQASQFNSLIGGYTTTSYDDLFDLTSAIRIARQSETIETIEGEVADIVPHEMPLVRGAKTYLQQYTEIDFKREITRFVAHEKLGIGPSNPEPTSLYYSTATTVSKLTLAASAPYSKTAIITSITSGWTIMDLCVDEPADLIFTLEYKNTDSNIKKIRKYNIDGTAGADVVDYPSGASKSANSFGIARSSQRIYAMEQNTAINGFTVNSYDYLGNFVDTIYIQTNGFGFGMGIGISPSEDYLFFHENIASGSPTRSLIRYNLIDDTSTAVGTPTSAAESSGGTEPNEIVIDSLYAAGGVFACFGEDLISFSYPDAPSDATITSNPGLNHLAVDRYNQNLYYVGIGAGPGTEKIREIGYDSSGDQEVRDEGAVITSLDMGYN